MAIKEEVPSWPLFIGGPMNGNQQRVEPRATFVHVPSITVTGIRSHVYQNMGYAYLYRGLH